MLLLHFAAAHFVAVDAYLSNCHSWSVIASGCSSSVAEPLLLQACACSCNWPYQVGRAELWPNWTNRTERSMFDMHCRHDPEKSRQCHTTKNRNPSSPENCHGSRCWLRYQAVNCKDTQNTRKADTDTNRQRDKDTAGHQANTTPK